jgi:glycyl-tRNA synthetase beta chain
MEDSVPRTVEGAMLSIGDKADTITGMFMFGKQPSGSKDPFALRRQANGIVKTIAEKKLPIGIERLFQFAREAYGTQVTTAEVKGRRGADYEFASNVPEAAKYFPSILAFMHERLEFYLRDVLGFKYDVVNAVLAAGADDVVDAAARAEAVSKVRPSADFESISVAFKRIKNILRQASETGKRVGVGVDGNALREAAEKDLAAMIPVTAKAVEELRQKHDYEPALVEISKLRPAVDTFFDKVMVMVEDEQVRANRLALLATLLKEFSTIADFSEIVTEGK